MSYNQGRHSYPKDNGYRSAGGGDTSPSNVVVLTSGDRVAVLSIYTSSQGMRICTITLAIKKKTPEAALNIECDLCLFAQQEARETLQVNEAIARAKGWLAGIDNIGDLL